MGGGLGLLSGVSREKQKHMWHCNESRLGVHNTGGSFLCTFWKDGQKGKKAATFQKEKRRVWGKAEKISACRNPALGNDREREGPVKLRLGKVRTVLLKK